MITVQDVTGVILAGGASTRMGGADKGLVACQGRPMIEHVIAAFRPQVAALLINANRNISRYATYGYQVISDEWPERRGPLAGVAAAMSAAKTEFIATMPCDNPFPPRDMVARMIRRMNFTGAKVCALSSNGLWQPMYLVAECSVRDGIVRCLEGGKRAVRDWLTSQNAVDLDCDSAFFSNLNSVVDLVQREENQDGC